MWLLASLHSAVCIAIRNLPSLLERPRALQEKIFTHLFEAAEIAKFNRQERYEYEESLKNYRDWFSVMETAKMKGKKEGIEEGLKQGMEKGHALGLEEGKELGRAEGEKRKALDIARMLKSNGVDFSIIAQSTGLSVDEIGAIEE